MWQVLVSCPICQQAAELFSASDRVREVGPQMRRRYVYVYDLDSGVKVWPVGRLQSGHPGIALWQRYPSTCDGQAAGDAIALDDLVVIQVAERQHSLQCIGMRG